VAISEHDKVIYVVCFLSSDIVLQIHSLYRNILFTIPFSQQYRNLFSKIFFLKNVFILWSRSFSIAIFVLHVLALCFAHTNPFAVSVSSYHGISLVMNFPLFSQRSSLITSRTAVISYFLKTTEISSYLTLEAGGGSKITNTSTFYGNRRLITN
jgi:hypothetical protein